MKHNLKRVASLFLAFVMLFSLMPTAFAVDQNAGEPVQQLDAAVYYIANAANGGRDNSGDGTEGKPYLTIGKAIQTAKEAGVQSLNIQLLSDIPSTQEIIFDSTFPLTIASKEGSTYKLQFTGTNPIGAESGFVKATGDANVTFENVVLAGSTGTYDGRVVYAANGAEVTLHNVTVESGRVNNTNTIKGGAGIYAEDEGTIHLSGTTSITGNTTTAGGGAVYVADGGTVTIADTVQITGNTAKKGGAIYAATQTKGYGGLTISGSVSITGNTATENGSGMYVERAADASVSGNVQITNNQKGGAENNVYLSENATMDISGATTAAKIGISADPEEAYRLVSLPDNYTIQPTTNGDEKGWSDDCGTWDIRYMNYQGVPGLYLYYKTLDITFENVDTLTSVTGTGINGESADFLKDNLPGTTNSDGVLTVPDSVAKGDGKDLSFAFACNPSEYRIPTEDVVSITSGGQNVPFTYTPDFEKGTATVTIASDEVDKLTDTIQCEISAEKYYDLTVRMDGPLYAMSSSITGIKDSPLVISESSKTGTTAAYKLTKDGNPVSGILVELYKEGTSELGGTATTDAEGSVAFTGLDSNSSYYPILKYSATYRVISRDIMSFDLSTLQGQTLSDAYTAEGGAKPEHITYDASTGKTTVTGLDANGTVVFSVDQAEDTITFMPNEGEATSAPATLSMTSKVMQAGASTYGDLAAATLTGYDFIGWFTEAEDGEKIDSNTAYTTGTSPRVLYAHWTARNDTAYQIQHWVEYASGGANAGYEEGVTDTKEVDGTTYYLYETSDYSDGTSDAEKDITSLDLKTMSDAELSWWTREGLTASFQENCKVLADGSSVFSIYYDRNAYTLTFAQPEAGTAKSETEIPGQDAGFGALVGHLPAPTLPGYEFGGWYDEGQLITETTIYKKTEGTELVSHWNTKKDTKWAIKVAVQDIIRDEHDVWMAADTYTEYKTVYLDNDKNLLTGETDTTITKNIADITELTFEGFRYVGYADSKDAGITASSDGSFQVYIDPTDVSTASGNKYNDAFDGGIVWLFYDRKTADVSVEDGHGNTTDGEIIYGGDFTGQLPEDPGKDGYDFSGWVDPSGEPVTEDTSANPYVEDADELTISPTWTARNYLLTYIPGDKASFVASDGSAGEKSSTVEGGYTDSKEVTYDAAMGDMPSASKVGYVFDGWFLESTEINKDTIVSVENVVISNAPTYTYEATRPLSAKYTPHSYTLVLDAGATKRGIPGTVSPERVTVTFDQPVANLPVPTLTGYRFVGWMLDLNDPSTVIQNGDLWAKAYTNGAEIPLYAAYVPETYQYTFDLNDQTGSTRAILKDTTIDYTEETFDSVYDGIFAVEAMRNGYEFKGWSLTPDGDVLTADDLNLLAQDTTVYAIWQPIEYNVKFVMKGAAMDLLDNTTLPGIFNPTAVYDRDTDTWTVKVKFDSTYGTLPVPTKEDCTYRGWLASAENWEEIDNEVIRTLPSYTDYLDKDGIVLTAVMEPWITFDPNGNTFSDGTTAEKKILQSEISDLPEVTKDGYHFDGWTTEEEPDNIVTLDKVKSFEEPTKLIPKFSANITFHANGGKMRSNQQESDTFALSEMASLPSATRSSYTLAGWFTAAEGGSQVTLDFLKTANVPTTVYAHWNFAGGGGGGGGGGGVSTVTITVTESEGVKVTPNGKVTVNAGSNQHFDIKADSGYVITDVLIDGSSVGAVNEFDFKKVTKDHTLEVKAEKKLLTTEHIAYVGGYPDGCVRPNANITRAEVAMIFYRLLSDNARQEYNATSAGFTDVKSGDWYGTAVATLANMKILNGYSDGTFKPNSNITRAEFATIAARFDHLESGGTSFSDVPRTHWAFAYIASASAKGWVNGYSDGSFKPDNPITRAETMTLVNRVLDRDTLMMDSLLSGMKEWPDNNKSAWYYLAVQEATNAHDSTMKDGTEIWTTLK